VTGRRSEPHDDFGLVGGDAELEMAPYPAAADALFEMFAKEGGCAGDTNQVSALRREL